MIDQSRRRRIAAGAGVEPHEVNELVKQFDGMADDDEGDGRHGHARPDAKKCSSCSRGACSIPAPSLREPKVGTGKRLTPGREAETEEAA